MGISGICRCVGWSAGASKCMRGSGLVIVKAKQKVHATRLALVDPKHYTDTVRPCP